MISLILIQATTAGGAGAQEPGGMSTDLIVALIGVATAIGTAIWTYVTTRKSNRELEQLKADLQEKQASKDARREYEFEARKRLYQEYEPLFFQLIEHSKNARYKIRNLARDARNGNLGEAGWTANSGYYNSSSIYKLLAPAAIFKLMQRRLTFIDLKVDERIETQFFLAKLNFFLFTEHFRLARAKPEIDYKPDDADANVKDDPAVYGSQGIVSGVMERCAELLIVEDKEKERLMSYGEFEDLLKQQAAEQDQKFYDVFEVFNGFGPQEKPVFWRILLAQLVVYETLLRSNQTQDFDANAALVDLKVARLDTKTELYVGAEDEKAFLDTHLDAVRNYFERHLHEYLEVRSKDD